MNQWHSSDNLKWQTREENEVDFKQHFKKNGLSDEVYSKMSPGMMN